MSKAVVLSRSLKLEWLDKTLEFWLETHDSKQTRELLNEYLARQIESPTVLRKTREILVHTWVEVDENLQQLRDMAADTYILCSQKERLAVHWVMLLAIFDLFKDLCGVIGKLTSTQDVFTTSQITRRIFELWGERTTLTHALTKNLKTLKDFGVIKQLKPGSYVSVPQPVHNDRLIELMLYGVIKSSDKLYHSVSGFDHHKELFPFMFDTRVENLSRSNLFKLDRVGGELVISI